MGTRSSIVVKVGDKVKGIYCHWDGYPSHNGRILIGHYNSQELAEQVISLGDLSSLDVSMECPDGHTYSTPKDGYSIAYGRDRGEDDTDAKEYGDYPEALESLEQECNYYWDGSRWLYEGKVLTEEIIAEDC